MFSAPGQLLRLACWHTCLLSQIVFVHENPAVGIIDVGLDLGRCLPSVRAGREIGNVD